MRRDPAALAAERFDVLVVGAGIVGACVAWDAATRGLRTALVDAGDFGGGTSANSLKIVHGGLRYLQQLDLRQMREYIAERSTWLRIAPHLVEPLPVLVPTRGRGLEARTVLRAALAVTDAVGWDRNRGLAPERRLPAGRALSREDALRLVPELDRTGLTGAVLFYDAQMYSAERLVLSAVQEAHAAGAVVANYAAFETPLEGSRGGVGARVRDVLSGDAIDVRADLIVNAAGPAAPVVAGRLAGEPPRPGAYSLALNLMIDGRGHRAAFTLTARSRSGSGAPAGHGRRLFVVPWRDRTIIGTAHYPYAGDSESFTLDEGHVARFLDEVNRAWPGAPLRRDEVVQVHRGLLPSAQGGGDVRLLRRHGLVRHERPGAPRAITVVGVKFTTGRLVAEHVTDLACRMLGRAPAECRTARTPLPGAPAGSVAALVADAERRHGGLLPADVLRHLVRTYGTGYERILAYHSTVSDWDRRAVEEAPVIKAQLVHAAREEMAQRPEDLVDRRTELGARGLSSAAAAALAADVLAAHAPAAGRVAGREGSEDPARGTAMPGRASSGPRA